MIDKLFEIAIGFLTRKPEEGALAKFTAHLLVPGVVMGLAVAGVFLPSGGLDFGEPISVAKLQTQVDTAGRVTRRPGITLIMEPVESEYRIPLTSTSQVWTSLDERTVRMNDDRLVLTPTELRTQSPLIGVSTPTTVVVSGDPQSQIWFPGSKKPLDTKLLEPRRSVAFIAYVLYVCAFTFGMSFAAILPIGHRVQEANGNVTTDP